MCLNAKSISKNRQLIEIIYQTGAWTSSGFGAIYGGMNWDNELDAVGLLCPLPVLKARKRLQAMLSGQVLRVVADDPAAIVDVPHFCLESGNELIDTQEDGAVQVYLIRKT